MRISRFGRLLLGSACALIVAGCGGSSPTAPTPEAVSVSGRLHEAPPTQEAAVGGATITVTGNRPLIGQVFVTDEQGRFVLPLVTPGNITLTFTKPGYETARVEVRELSRVGLEVGMVPERRELTLSVSGTNDCVDLPNVLFTISGTSSRWGGRLYARVPIHHDGVIRIRQETLRRPFSIGTYGSVLRLLPSGTVDPIPSAFFPSNEYPVTGGYVYLILFGGDADWCSEWAMDATHPN